MTAKRALVVDDSRSARISLQKMLEQYGIAVDFAESGEAALDYLRHHLVDAIFMDHSMPGMDGLETVVAIKSNPRTATIPVMMYTAKEGEVYVSQARALGAIGVLPKQVQPGVLEEMLRKLGLLREHGAVTAPSTLPNEPGVAGAAGPDTRVAAVGMGDASPGPGSASVREPVRGGERSDSDLDAEYDLQALGASVQAIVTRVLNEQHVQLRSDILTAHRDFARQVAAEILARERPQALGAGQPGPVPETAESPPDRPGTGRRRLSLAWLLAVPLLAGGWFGWQLWDEREALAAEVGQLQQTVKAGESELESLRAAQASDLSAERARTDDRVADLLRTVEWALNQDPRVGVDEPAFDDRRASELETLLGELVGAGFRGKVRLEAHLGEFCLAVGVDGRERLAAPGTALENCARIGHPLDDSTALEARQTAAFAGFMASSPLVNDRGIEVDLVALDRDGSVPAAPVPPGIMIAGEWNEAARQNHRIRFVLEPADR